MYVLLSRWTTGGPFFTRTTLLFDLLLFPAVLIGLFSGRKLLHKLPERGFLIGVLVLSTAGAIKLLLP